MNSVRKYGATVGVEQPWRRLKGKENSNTLLVSSARQTDRSQTHGRGERRADNVNVKQAFQLTAANKCHLISSLINKTLAKGVRTSIIILSNVQTTQSAQFSTVTHTIRTHCLKGLWCCANLMHSSKACMQAQNFQQFLPKPGHRGLDPVNPILCKSKGQQPVTYAGQAASEYSLGSQTPFLHNHSFTHILIWDLSTTVQQCSTVLLWEAVRESCKNANLLKRRGSWQW